MFSRLLSTLQILLLINGTTIAEQCKVYPNDSSWPDTVAWQSLNETISGRLITPTAVGAVCHPSNPAFNNDTCTDLLSRWANTSFIASNPYLPDYNDDSCSPAAPDANCSTAGYPAYVINAINAADVQAGVNFAREHNVRLIVKATGHDWPGRSSGAGSLSIWTHNLRGIDVTMEDPVAVRYGGIASVKIAAGHRWREIYAEAARNNVTVVGGADPNVGVGGWILNGGHSPISAFYGMGADQVLAFEVVTADGKYLNVNETSEPDLFWALRGGGGSTYAVMLSVTVKAYPPLGAAVTQYTLTTAADSDTMYSLLAYFHTQVPTIAEAGGMGYHYYIRSDISGLPGIDVLTGVWFFPGKSIEEMNAILGPLYTGINSSSWAVDPVSATRNETIFPTMMGYLAQSTGEDGGGSGRLGSYLLDGPALTGNFTMLKEQFKVATAKPWWLISHVIAGPGTRNAVTTIPGGSNAVLPAWRKAYTHIGKSKCLSFQQSCSVLC